MLENILLSEGGKCQSKVIMEPQISQIKADNLLILLFNLR